MKNKLLFLLLAVGACMKMTAQVDDVSVFITPTASYNWFDNKSTVEDGAMYGIQAGFGFGKTIELRGIYEKSSNLDQKFGRYADNLNDLGLDFELTAKDIRVTRKGGEIKANLASGDLAPYLVLGTGIQTYKRKFSEEKTYKTENIYGSGGIGLKINLSPRLTLNFEGRLFGYNMKPNSMLADPELMGDVSGDYSFEEWLEGQKSETMFNYSLNAGLQLYLGGTNEKDLSAMDRAYKQRFGSGLSDFKVTLAPTGAYVDFDDNTAFRDTYLLGAELGVDFTDYVGLRAYYLQATEDEKISLDFDKMSMYGADFVGRLNVGAGISPYVTVGGGYINVSDNYIGEVNDLQFINLSSKYFAKGCIGIDMPLGKRVDLFGAANLLYTTDRDNSDIGQIEGTEELKKHMMYNFGFRVKLSKSVDVDKVVAQAFDEEFAPERRAYDESLEDYEKRIKTYDQKVKERDSLIANYQNRIKELEKELKQAFDENDEIRAAEIMQEKKYLEGQIEKQEKPENPLIRMTPAELESLIDKVLKGVEEEESQKTIEQRLDRLEDLLIRMNQAQAERAAVPSAPGVPRTTMSTEPADVAQSSANDRLIEEISRLKQQLRDQEATIAQMQANIASQDREEASPRKVEIHAPSTPDSATDDSGAASGFNFKKGMAVFIGPSFGDATNVNIGLRSYHAFSNTSIMFTPDIYVGLGSKMAFGVNANGIVPIDINSDFTPYVGVGVGLNYINKKLKFAPNFIAGTTYKLGNGASVFLEYTGRGAFKNNQVALGYRFKF